MLGKSKVNQTRWNISRTQGVTYSAGVSRILQVLKGVYECYTNDTRVHSIPHIHREIETIAYLLEGEFTLFHGNKLENQTLVKKSEQIFIPEM